MWLSLTHSVTTDGLTPAKRKSGQPAKGAHSGEKYTARLVSDYLKSQPVLSPILLVTGATGCPARSTSSLPPLAVASQLTPFARDMSHKRAQRPHPRLQWHHQPLTALATSSASLAAVAVSAAVSSQNTEHPVFHRPHPIQPHLTLQASLPSANPFSPTHHTKGVTEIIPHLYISDLSFAENPACLSSHRITHILSALPEAIYVPPATLLHPHPPPTRLQIRVEDFPFAELAVHLPRTTEWIGDALTRDPNARVLVHCIEGISRSVSIVAAYLMAHFGWTPSEAVKFIKNKRRAAEPNFGFVQQLHEYARDSLGRMC
ncbi:hypothetical protein APHAL10511_004178 [Amanita phalloides]|nr:hypothetical protein APHAL10511_004178 [Amanita phalloides]